MANYLKNVFSGFGGELLEHIREDYRGRLDDAAFEERIIGIENATSAMIEVEIKDEKIIQVLQKYWDLRLSEAKLFVERQHRILDDGFEK